MAEMTPYRLSIKCKKSKRGVLPQYNNLTGSQKTEIINLYKTGEYTFAEIARMYRKHISSVHKFLHKSGFSAIPQSKSQRKYSLDDSFFDEIDTHEKSYILGFLYADGYHSDSNNTISLNISKKDKPILVEISKLINSNRPIQDRGLKTRTGKDRVYSKMAISSSNISEKMTAYGVIRCKTFKIRFPFFLRKEFWPGFVRGYFDGDGCISIGKKVKSNICVSFTSNKKFLGDLMFVFGQELGLNNVKISTASNSNDRIGVLAYSGRNNCIKIRDWMYGNDTLSLKRKKDKLYSI